MKQAATSSFSKLTNATPADFKILSPSL